MQSLSRLWVLPCAGSVALAVACSGSGTGPLFGENPGPADAGGPDAVAEVAPDTGSAALPPCDVDPAADPRVVRDECGVFVAPFANGGDDGAPGSAAEPMATIARAVREARARRAPRVYVCNATYDEALDLDASADGVSLVGALSCPASRDRREGAWVVTPDGKATVRSPDAGPALVLRDHSRSAEIIGIELVARDAVRAGESSIALRVQDCSSVVLRRARVVAGRGMPGADGARGHAASGESQRSAGFYAGGDAGGKGGTMTCWSGVTAGGEGGSVELGGYFSGLPGTPRSTDAGNGGNREACASAHVRGGDGQPGKDGITGSAARVLGVVDGAGAWLPASGERGTDGAVGEGGGGGAAALTAADPARGMGPGGGGGGGAGGCPGGGGGGGGGGGSSIAVLVTGSVLTLVGSRVLVADGGAGGRGGAGPDGSAGSVGADGFLSACSGGAGGAGGRGGSGAGGAGGLSVGVLSARGASVTLDAAVTLGAGGRAGAGGRPGTNDGLPGTAQATLQTP